MYLSGWQVAGDANLSGHTYPDQSLYPANSVPTVVRRINNALLRADEIARIEVASAPLGAKSSNATWRMRAFAVKSVLRSAVDIWLYLLCGMVSEVTVCVTFGLYWSSKLYGILYEYTV